MGQRSPSSAAGISQMTWADSELQMLVACTSCAGANRTNSQLLRDMFPQVVIGLQKLEATTRKSRVGESDGAFGSPSFGGLYKSLTNRGGKS
jgi:hypothetical protein